MSAGFRRLVVALVLLAGCSSASQAVIPCGAPRATARDARWTVNLPSAPGAVVVDAEGAIVTLDGRVRAVDHEGATRWEVAVAGAGLDWPVIDGSLVFVPTTAGGAARCVALDRNSGATLGHLDAGPGEVAAAAAAGGALLCAGTTGTVVAADRETFAPRWLVRVADLFGGQPVALSPRGALAVDPASAVVALVAAVGEHWALLGLDLATGADAGVATDLGTGPPPSAVATDGRGTLVVGDGSRKGVLVIDLERRKVRAAVPTPHAFDPASIPLVAGGAALVVDRGGGLTSVDLEDGALRWRAELGSPVLDTRPVLVDDTVVLTDWVRELHAFGWPDGRRVRPALSTAGAVAVGADAARGWLVAAGRGGTGNRLDGAETGPEPSGIGQDRPLQCRSEPGRSTGQPARP
jgi:outer membrane protein assembly factor BamB